MTYLQGICSVIAIIGFAVAIYTLITELEDFIASDELEDE